MRNYNKHFLAICLIGFVCVTLSCSKISHFNINSSLSGTKSTSEPSIDLNSKVQINKGSAENEILWKGEETYPYKLTMHEWKEEYSLQSERGPLKRTNSIQYPSISGMSDSKLEQTINQLIYDEVKAIADSFISDIPYDSHDWRKCYIMLLTEDYLSIRFDGGNNMMRTNRFSEVLNINLKTGKKLDVGDFFKPGSDAAQLIMDFCKQDLKRQYEEYYNEKIGEQFSMLIDWGCTPESCSKANLTQSGFYLIFDDLFSRAEGRWVVHAPYQAFGEQCKFDVFKNAYGFFSVPDG